MGRNALTAQTSYASLKHKMLREQSMTPFLREYPEFRPAFNTVRKADDLSQALRWKLHKMYNGENLSWKNIINFLADEKVIPEEEKQKALVSEEALFDHQIPIFNQMEEDYRKELHIWKIGGEEKCALNRDDHAAPQSWWSLPKLWK